MSERRDRVTEGALRRGAAVAGLVLGLQAGAAAAADLSRVEAAVDAAVRPVIAAHDIPGLAVAVTVRGQRRFFSYGVASRESGQRVTEGTLFEIGSISKVFTATLAAHAAATGRLSLADPASRHMPALEGSAFDRVTLLDLGTYTAGGLPLQFPKEVSGHAGMVDYYRGWRRAHEPGTHRVYSNPSLGLFGHLAARALGEPFAAAMEGRLLPMLGLTRTHLAVPAARQGDHAWGYTKENRPIRVGPGLLDAEAYGLKSTAADMIRFVEANMGGPLADEALRPAIAATQVPYYRVGETLQGLGWEMYPYPTPLDTLVAGNSSDMALKAHPATRLDPARRPAGDLLLNKTGATNGFGAYAAFVPARGIGVVILANRNYPNAARVRAAHAILQALDAAGAR